MECPSCSELVGGVSLVVGYVKITTFHCKCGRLWRSKELLVSFDKPRFVAEVERLLTKYPADRPVHVRLTIELLQNRLDRYVLDGEAAVLSQRRLDSWERQFLKRMKEEADYL